MDQSKEYDVIIVGGSIAGCTVATFLGRHGLKVALLERQPNLTDYKKLCTHFIQSSATPTIQRLGLDKAIEAAGGIRNSNEFWTQYGWIRPAEDGRFPAYGYNIQRKKLDPLLRQMAQQTPGVDLYWGYTAQELLAENGRFTGIRATHDRHHYTFHAPLTVAADGHYSKVAQLANVPTQTRPNNRFAYMAYYRNLPLKSGQRSQFWLLNPDAAYMFPNDDDLTLAVCVPTKDKLDDFKKDIEGNFLRFFKRLPDGPNMSYGERVSDIFGILKYDLISRQTVLPGLALVGDAALSSDPLWGVGCGWAFQSAEWLAEATADALLQQRDLEPALHQYQQRHKRHLTGHHRYITSIATGRRFYTVERLSFAAAAKDPACARHMHAFGGRHISAASFFSPLAFARTLWVYATKRPHKKM
jgi:flavin-dependent dehydrogenase